MVVVVALEVVVFAVLILPGLLHLAVNDVEKGVHWESDKSVSMLRCDVMRESGRGGIMNGISWN